jgi:hypothetical protein
LEGQIITYCKFPLNEELLPIRSNVSMGWTRLVCTVPLTNTHFCSQKMYHGSGLPAHNLTSQFYCTAELNIFKQLTAQTPDEGDRVSVSEMSADLNHLTWPSAQKDCIQFRCCESFNSCNNVPVTFPPNFRPRLTAICLTVPSAHQYVGQ